METRNKQPYVSPAGGEQETGLLGDVAAEQRSVVSWGHVERSAALPEVEAAIAAARAAIAACPACKGKGWLRKGDFPYGHPDFGKIEKCACLLAVERAKRRRDIMKLSSLGEVREKSFRSFNTRIPGVQQAAKAASAYAKNPDGWLVLLGPVGCGKTHLAAAIANACFDKLDMEVLFVTVADLLDHLRATFAPTSEVTYDEQFARMREAELLVLDDLGAQHATDWAREKLFQLINFRYNQANVVDQRTGRRRAATVVTSNLFDLNGVEERIRSRLRDASMSQVVTFGNEVQDYRPRNPHKAS